ncbi:MAG: glycosyltransferase family 39 protein [Planctomycetia bacterium]|nr:glycosyltransferase family 39 protein [Planctomycetia bacterium]
MDFGKQDAGDCGDRPEATLADKSQNNFRLSLRDFVLIASFGLSMLLINLGSVRVLTFHETVFAQPAKEMLRTGRWIVPTIAGEPFFDRTPLTAWSIALSMKIFGSDAEWVVRLPSVLFGVGTAILIGMMAARWFGRRIGLLAALIELTTVQTLTFARLAEADTLLCFTVTAAMYFFALGNVASPRRRIESRWLPVAFSVALAASFMVKWLFGPAFIGLGCLAFCVLSRDRKAWKFLFDPFGIVVAALLTIPWLVAAYREQPTIVDAFVSNHFHRFGGDMGSREPWFAYFYLIPFLLMPWIPFAGPVLASRLRNSKTRESFWLFGVCWFVSGMVLLSWSTFKAKHYAIPLLPPLVVAAAVGLHEYLQRRRIETSRLLPGFIGAALATGSAIVAFLEWKRPTDAHALAVIVTMITLGGTAALCFERRRRVNLQLVATFATLWIASVAVQTWIMPTHDSFRPLAELGRRTSNFVPPGTVVHLVKLPEVQIPFYIDRPQRRWDVIEKFTPEEAALASEKVSDTASDTAVSPSAVYVVTSRDYVEHLSKLSHQVEVLDSGTRSAHFTSDRDRLVLLRMGLAADSRPAAARPNGATVR